MGRLHSLPDDFQQIVAQGIQIYLVPQAATESRQDAGRVVLAPVKTTIYEILEATPQRIEQGGDGERGDDDRELRLASRERAEDVLQRDDASEVDQHQRRCQSPVNQGAVDYYIDIVKAVAQHSYPDRRGQGDDHQIQEQVVEDVRQAIQRREDRDERCRVQEPLHLLALDPSRPTEPHHHGQDRPQTPDAEQDTKYAEHR